MSLSVPIMGVTNEQDKLYKYNIQHKIKHHQAQGTKHE